MILSGSFLSIVSLFITCAGSALPLAATRDKRTGGGTAPKHCGGKHHKGETAHRGTPPANNNQRSQPTEGVQNNNIYTDTERSIKQNEKESENRQREQPLWRQGASGRHVWDTVRYYHNMTQAEPNDALQALTAQIPDRGWRLAARKISGGADGEIEKIVTHRTQ